MKDEGQKSGFHGRGQTEWTSDVFSDQEKVILCLGQDRGEEK